MKFLVIVFAIVAVATAFPEERERRGILGGPILAAPILTVPQVKTVVAVPQVKTIVALPQPKTIVAAPVKTILTGAPLLAAPAVVASVPAIAPWNLKGGW